MPSVLCTILLVACCTAATSTIWAQTDSPTNPLLLQNVRVIVGDGSVLESTSILIEGASISAIGGAANLSLPSDTVILDLRGKTVMPALIDAHAHLGYQAASSWGAQNYSRQNLIDNLNRYAYYGFSAVFSAGSDPAELAIQLQRSQRNGEIPGARFLFAAGMAPPGQGPNNQFLEHALAVGEATGMHMLYGLNDAVQARQAVRDVAMQGIAFIKIWVDDRAGSQEKLQPAIYRAVIDEARAQGIQVFVHQQRAIDMPDLLRAGADGFLHGRIGAELNEALAQQIKAANAFVVPNLGLGELRREAIGEDSFLQQTLPVAVANRLSVGAGPRQLNPELDTERDQEYRESLVNLLDAGVDILLGTDAGAIPDHFFGYTGHRELEIFVRLGMTPMQALIAATSAPARRLGLDDLGLLKPGYSADLLILDENPLEDIRHTRAISRVYLRGQEIDRVALRNSFQKQ